MPSFDFRVLKVVGGLTCGAFGRIALFDGLRLGRSHEKLMDPKISREHIELTITYDPPRILARHVRQAGF
jgi:hypothetical protein